MKIRQDAWSHEDDLLLAETVLRHIRTGSTQLNAFEEVGNKLNRTSAACGFRWNAEVRQKYEQAMELAKKQRKERKRILALQSQQNNKEQMITNLSFDYEKTVEAEAPAPFEQLPRQYAEQDSFINRQINNQTDQKDMDINTIIAFLERMKVSSANSQIVRTENERLARENYQLVSEKEKLQKKLQRVAQENEMIQEDYQSLLHIMDRARRMVSIQNQSNLSPLDENNEGFEQIAK
ncbi:RsfA family transcriptional regulator [Calidifontibacillus oryziterrae]|uniref:RsfA family transcriptional regulator n=1 Tax=Calidifontibacillus oryziterrae TaxID=1191699 RepID=UPI0003150DD5|nr:RsfA family transcriptional regulator [Calidifontibacillus oryziterrae]